MTRRAIGWLAISLALTYPSTAGAAVVQDTASIVPPVGRFAVARARIDSAVNNGLVSMTVAVAMNGRIIWAEGFGWADKERRIRASPHSMYGVGSISKSYTATAMMTLVEKGLVQLDRPANDYLGRGKIRGFAGDADKATVRLVLSHRAGLPRHHQEFYADEGYGRPTMDETIMRYGILVNPPGERYVYANLDYGIADHIIERVSKRPYEDFMVSDVFIPLGLTRTYVLVPPVIRPGTVVLYDQNGKIIPYFDFDQRGGGSTFSSMYDLVRFGMFHLKNRLPEQRHILADSTIDRMHSAQFKGGPGPAQDYAFAWNIDDDVFGYQVFSHSGGMPGGATNLRLVPAKNIVVAAASNTYPRDRLTFNIADDILAALLPDYAAGLERRRASPPGVAPRPAFVPTPELVGTWTGQVVTWQRTLPIRMVVKPDGDVHVTFDNQPEALLNGVSYMNGDFNGRFTGSLSEPDIGRHPHVLILENLRLRNGKLCGTFMASEVTGRGHYSLPSWVEMERK